MLNRSLFSPCAAQEKSLGKSSSTRVAVAGKLVLNSESKLGVHIRHFIDKYYKFCEIVETGEKDDIICLNISLLDYLNLV